jgi:hypothetical protein
MSTTVVEQPCQVLPDVGVWAEGGADGFTASPLLLPGDLHIVHKDPQISTIFGNGLKMSQTKFAGLNIKGINPNSTICIPNIHSTTTTNANSINATTENTATESVTTSNVTNTTITTTDQNDGK